MPNNPRKLLSKNQIIQHLFLNTKRKRKTAIFLLLRSLCCFVSNECYHAPQSKAGATIGRLIGFEIWNACYFFFGRNFLSLAVCMTLGVPPADIFNLVENVRLINLVSNLFNVDDLILYFIRCFFLFYSIRLSRCLFRV